MTTTIERKNLKVEILDNAECLYVTIKDKVFYIDYTINDEDPFIDTWNLGDDVQWKHYAITVNHQTLNVKSMMMVFQFVRNVKNEVR